jgi:hypothetical protein
LSARLLRQSLDALLLLASPQDLGLAWQELRDKMRVFFWVKDVSNLLHLPPEGSYVPLTELVDRAYALDAFPALWAVEGSGHYYADSLWDGERDPQGLLTDARASSVPDKAMTMLHAGIGLSFAQHLLGNVTPRTPAEQVRQVVQHFIALCNQNSRSGYVGAALESLGLVARDFHPQALVPVIDRELAQVDEEAQAYFWHGVGRAIYFSPSYFLPVGPSPWRAIEMAHGEAPHELGRLNAIAGLAWAVTMVNLQKPEVLEAVLRRHGEELGRDDAFANGIGSSIIMRSDTTPGQPFVADFCGHQGQSDPDFAALWSDLVKRPCEQSLGQLYPLLKEQKCLGKVFRYQPIAELVTSLDNAPRASPGRSHSA